MMTHIWIIDNNTMFHYRKLGGRPSHRRTSSATHRASSGVHAPSGDSVASKTSSRLAMGSPMSSATPRKTGSISSTTVSSSRWPPDSKTDAWLSVSAAKSSDLAG